MATIKKRGNSYLIRCYDGYDQTGRQIERTMTWKIPAGMSEKKAEREARHQAELFEEKVRTGQSAEQKIKFDAFESTKSVLLSRLKYTEYGNYSRYSNGFLQYF